jgi:hypothetical protein
MRGAKDGGKPVESIADIHKRGATVRRPAKGVNMSNASAIKRRVKTGLAMAGVAVVAGLGLTSGAAQADTHVTDAAAEPRAGGCASGYLCG